MLLIDFNGITVRALTTIKHTNTTRVHEARNIFYNTFLPIKKKFKNHDVVICADSPSWRKRVWPYYKNNRKKIYKSETMDWQFIFDTTSMLFEELDQHFKYKCLKVDGAEADDIIATLVKKRVDKDLIIVSRDKDLFQLTRYNNTRQYEFIDRKFVKKDLTPEEFLENLIIHGDISDGIPNILSEDDTFVMGKRQKTIRKTKLLEIKSLIGVDDKINKYYERNKMLIDFDYIPKDIEINIMNEYSKLTDKKSDVFNYLFQYNLNNLIQEVGNF